jgi:acetyl-CoA carboxylase biotin carboxyl carrier protein
VTEREDTTLEAPVDAIARAAAELVPQLAERLARHGLGEIEVAHGDLRLRVRGGTPLAASAPASTVAPAASATMATAAAAAPATDASSGLGVSSPAVGFFVYADGLGPGLAVDKGDSLGHVEMLGVRHDVRAPRRGTVRHLVAESGEAVEYGQVVVELEPADAAR